MFKKILIIGIPLLALLLLVGWRFVQKGKEEAELTQQQAQRQGGRPSVEVAKATPATITSGLEAVGSVESPQRVEIAPKTSGRIEFLQVREGDQVKRGQVLVRVDGSELQAQVLQQQANVAEARSRLAQAQLSAAPTAAGVRGQIERQQAGVASAEAEFQQMTRNQEAQIETAASAVRDAEAGIAAAEAGLRNAQAVSQRERASLSNAQTRLARVESLYRQGFIAAQEVDDAITALEVQRRAVEVAGGQVQAAESQVASARAQMKGAQSRESIARRTSAAEITTARARVRQAEASLREAIANRAQNPAYQQNVAALSSSVKAAEAQLAQARARLGETVLRSPINGVVTARSADPGALASPSEPVLVVQSLESLYVNASVGLEESAQAIVGTPVQVEFDALPGQVFRGPIAHVNPAADPQSRRISFRVRLDNRRGKIKPGMFGRVLVPTRRVQATVTVPREALKANQDGSQSLIVVGEEDVAEQRTVEVGAADEKRVQITRGVKAGEQVVTLSYRPVRDGQKVQIGRPDSGGRQGRQREGQPRGNR